MNYLCAIEETTAAAAAVAAAAAAAMECQYNTKMTKESNTGLTAGKTAKRKQGQEKQKEAPFGRSFVACRG